MLYQIYHQSKKDLTVVEEVAQKEIAPDHAELSGWLKEVERKYPLPEGHRWLLCWAIDLNETK